MENIAISVARRIRHLFGTEIIFSLLNPFYHIVTVNCCQYREPITVNDIPFEGRGEMLDGTEASERRHDLLADEDSCRRLLHPLQHGQGRQNQSRPRDSPCTFGDKTKAQRRRDRHLLLRAVDFQSAPILPRQAMR